MASPSKIQRKPQTTGEHLMSALGGFSEIQEKYFERTHHKLKEKSICKISIPPKLL
jgi:hypothetical protein